MYQPPLHLTFYPPHLSPLFISHFAMSLLNIPPPSPPPSPPPFHPAGANEVLIQNFRNQVEEFRMKERYQETEQNLAIFAIKEQYVQCQNIYVLFKIPPTPL